MAGFTLLHLGRYAKAIEEYLATEELAPGWYHCRADLCVAEALLAGRIDRRAFEAWVALEDGGGAPSERLEIAGMAVDAFPDFAPFLLYYGKALAALEHGDQAADAFRRGLHAAPDAGTCTRLLVELAQYLEADERKQLLEAAVELDGDKVAAAMAGRQLLERVAARVSRTGVQHSTRMPSGDAREEIIREADDWPADLIVLGTQGRTGLKHFLLGSVALSVAEHAPCSVELARPRRA